jgi:hypothetical protein
MRLPQARFTMRQMMATVAVVGIELGLITLGASGMGHQPTALDWLVSTAFVLGLQFLILLLVGAAAIYIKSSQIKDVLLYKGPVKRKSGVMRKDDS